MKEEFWLGLATVGMTMGRATAPKATRGLTPVNARAASIFLEWVD